MEDVLPSEQEEAETPRVKKSERPYFYGNLFVSDWAKRFLTAGWVQAKCKLQVDGPAELLKKQEQPKPSTQEEETPEKRPKLGPWLRWKREGEKEEIEKIAKRQGIEPADVPAFLDHFSKRLERLRSLQTQEIKKPGAPKRLEDAKRSELVARDAWQYAPRPRDVNWTDLPQAGRDDLHVYYYGSSYSYDAREQGTAINVWGVLDDKHATPVCARLRGFLPHFYVRLPQGWGSRQVQTLADVLNQELRRMAERDYKRMDRQMTQQYDQLCIQFRKAGLDFNAYLEGKYHFGEYGAQYGKLRISVDDAKKIRSYQYQSELVGELRGMLSRNLDQLPFVQRWQYVRAKDLHFWTPGDQDTTFVDIYLLHPKLVRMARDLLENPKGMKKKPRMSGPKRKEDKPEPSKSSSSSSSEEWRNRPENWDIPPWFDPDEFGVEGLPHVSYEDPHGDEIQYRGFDVFEADVPFLIRELVDKGEASGCVWYHVPANKWQPIVSQASRLSDCPLEISVRWEDWKQATDKKYELLVPDLKKLALDIECKTNGKFFPRSDTDEVIGIACSVTDINCKDEPGTAPDSKHKMFGFCLKSVKPRTMAAYTFWYDDERELLSDFLFFVTRVINADVIEHYNGSGFDLPYLVNRAAHLGLPNFNLMGRSRNRRLNLSQMTNKGKEKNFVEIEGRINFDLYRRVLDEYASKFTSFGLNSVAWEMIKQRKRDMPYEILEEKVATEPGRGDMMDYVLFDVYCEERSCLKLTAVRSSMMMSRICCVPWQTSMDRSNGVKVEGKLRHIMKPHGGSPTDTFFKRTLRKGNILRKNARAQMRAGDKPTAEAAAAEEEEEGDESYTGAIVLEPRLGFYGKLKVSEKTRAEAKQRLHNTFSEKAEAGALDRMATEQRDEGDDEEEEREEREEEREQEERDVLLDWADPMEDAEDDPDSVLPNGYTQSEMQRMIETADARLEAAQGPAEVDEIAAALARSSIRLEERDLDAEKNWNMPRHTRQQRRQLYLYMRRRWRRILRWCKARGLNLQGRFTTTADFASMYPSIIRAHNLCYITQVTNARISKYGLEEGRDYFRVPEVLVMYDPVLKKRVVQQIPSPRNAAFVYPHLRKGLLPELEEQLGKQRDAIKKRMKALKKEIEALKAKVASLPKGDGQVIALQREIAEKQLDYEILDILQNTIKILMNSIYGLTGDRKSVWFFLGIAAMVTTYGRSMITRTRVCIEEDFGPEHGDRFIPIVVYGDTDSVMVNQVGHVATPGEACAEGKRMCDHVNETEFSKEPPIELAFEKVFEGMDLASKKRYVAKKHVYDAKDAVIDLKGMSNKRKSPPPFVRGVLNKATDVLIGQGDLEGAMDHVKQRLVQLATHRVPLTELFERSQLTKDPSEYGGSKEEVKQKSAKERKRIQELKSQHRIYSFFKPTGKRKASKEEEEEEQDDMVIDPLEEQMRAENDGEAMQCVIESVIGSLVEKEQEAEAEVQVKKRVVPVPAAVQVAQRLAELNPDNPPTAGSVVHLLVVESDHKKEKTKGQRALDPMEAIATNARPDIEYYLKSLESPLGSLFYFPMVAAGLIRPDDPAWSPKLQPLSAYIKEEADIEREFEERNKEPKPCADVLLEDERMVRLPRITAKERTKRVCEVLYQDMRRKRVRTNLQSSSAMSGHVQELLSCGRCHLAMQRETADMATSLPNDMPVQARGSLCLHLCADCERDELLDFRARCSANAYHRKQQREEKKGEEKELQKRVRAVHATTLRKLRRKFPTSLALWKTPEAEGGPRANEIVHLKRLYEEEAKVQVAKLDEAASSGASVLSKCLVCMHGDSESVSSCQAFSCELFGLRNQARNEVSEQLEVLVDRYALRPEQFGW